MQSFDFLADLHCRWVGPSVVAFGECPLHETRLCRDVGLARCDASNLRDRLADRGGGRSEFLLATELFRLPGLLFSTIRSAVKM
ncbi:hypothetical protein KXD40_001338 [Peronospora effusa]|nr:hypothetical protein KXD40_001338 [Peronospora effusa]